MIAVLLLAWTAQTPEAAPDPQLALAERIFAAAEPAAELAATLQREAWLEHGEADALLAALRQLCEDQAESAARAHAFEVFAELQFREGLLADAASSVARALEQEVSVPRLFLHARLLDALDRGDDAVRAYERLRESADDPALLALVDRRIALIEAFRAPSPGASAEAAAAPAAPSRLYELAAADGVDEAARSRAAVVLAMLGRPQEAILLYPATGTGAARFRREIRLAEWALAARDHAAAQAHAWQARLHATQRRDRLYALTVLSEAHRADGTLDALIARFAAEPELDDDARLSWLDLLRETARVDEALALFASADEDGFSPEMRRLMLDICREAGREEELIAAYRALIAAEPEQLEWREGLARHRLERGQQEEARAVWSDLLAADAAPERMLLVAESTAALGLDDLARGTAERLLGAGELGLQARLFLFDLEWRRGRIENAQAELERFDREADPRAPARVELAEAYERIGLKQRAVEVLEGVRAVRGGESAEEDLDMRLAWLLSETGEEERALELWRGLWRKVQSAPRRRQIEDRLLATAARLGVLADIAVELERKLADGSAEERDASLLVRLYQKVGDPVSAAEILEEYLKRLGDDPIGTLDEKARIYLAGRDYYRFERTIEKLLELDPERRSDRLRQLAMSMLERGKPQEARAVLRDLAALEDPSDAAEFEAGVLSLAKLDDEAIRVYRKGLAAHPGRIDSYLLLAEAMRRVGAADRAVGLFQFLVETAGQDDLFTVAVDGVLNMRARPAALRWTLRAILERLAARDDKTYLFQLCADLYEELEDNEGRMRALEASLPIAGEQRASILRELMDLALGRSLNSYTVVNGRLVPMRTGGDEARRLAYGRRLIGIGDLVPPDVYLELGEAFLTHGEVSNAIKTFDLARDVPDWPSFQRQIAASFENARFVAQSLSVYERLMASAGADATLLLKAGELHEELGRDARAAELYRSGLELLLDRFPLSSAAVEQAPEETTTRWMPRNLNEHETLFPVLERGLLAAAATGEVRAFADALHAGLRADLEQLAALGEPRDAPLAGVPRVRERSALLRRLAVGMGWLDLAESADLELLRTFPGDATLLTAVCDARAEFGYADAAIRLVARSERDEAQRNEALVRFGAGTRAGARGPLPPNDAVRALLPLLLSGEQDAAVRMLRGVDLRGSDRATLPALQQLLSAALFLEDPYVSVQLAQAALRILAGKASDYNDVNVADLLFKRLRKALDADSFDLVVDGYVTELLGDTDAAAFQNHLRVLARLRRELGRDLVDLDTLRGKIEACLPDRSYFINALTGLVEPAQRLALVQPVWSLVPPTHRSNLALSLLNESIGQLDEAYAVFLVQAFLDGVGDVEDAKIFAYAIERALRGGGEIIPYLEPVVEAVAAQAEDNPVALAQLAAVRIERGRMGSALEAMSAAVAALASTTQEEDYNLYTARRALVAAFVPENADRLLAAIQVEEGRGGDAERLGVLRAEALRALGDREAELRAAEEALQAAPDDLARVAALYQQLEQRGELVRSMALLERLAAQPAGGEPWRQRLAMRWMALGNYVRVKQLREAEAPPVDAGQGDGKLARADLNSVRKAAEEARLDDARAEYRRSWRTFGTADRARGIYYGSSYYSGGFVQPWPVPGAQPADAPKPERKSGLAAWNVDRDPVRTVQREPQRSFTEGLATYAFGRSELERQSRILRAADVTRSAATLRGLACAQIEELGEPAARAAWLAMLEEGRDGARERAVYLAFLEDAAARLTPEERAAFERIAARVPPQDSAGLRSVARVFAALGDEARAERIYQWLASLATASTWTPSGTNAISAADLITEVARVLDGDARLRALEAILRRADPGGSSWDREHFLRLTLETWLRVAGAETALRSAEAALAEVGRLDRGLLRRPAILGARIYADVGRLEDAVRMLEIALCSFDPEDAQFASDEWYAVEDRLRAPQVGVDELLRVFPGGEGRAPPAAEWLALAAEAALAWRDAGRLHPDVARTLLLLLTARTQAAGLSDLARTLLDAAWNAEDLTDWERLIAADLERLLGGEVRAQTEEAALFAERRLDAQRAPQVLRQIAAERGAAAALAEGELAAEWQRQRPLLETLVALAEEAGAADRAVHWRAELAAQQEAATALEIDW
jgi:hypothetical protein